ncbi:MAG: hypothetical protein RLZZ236_1955 [Bacteroidota bacterium]
MMEELTPPLELVIVEYHFNVLSSIFSEMNDTDLEEILNHFLDVFRGIFTKKEITSIFIYPELDWDNDGFYHQIVIRFCIIGDHIKKKRFELNHQIKNTCRDLFGGDYSVRIMIINELTDLLIELLPIPFEEMDITNKEFNQLNYFPDFYTKDLYSFLLNFYKSINQKQFSSKYFIQL